MIGESQVDFRVSSNIGRLSRYLKIPAGSHPRHSSVQCQGRMGEGRQGEAALPFGAISERLVRAGDMSLEIGE